MNESRQQQLYFLVHLYSCTVQNCECDGVWWSCLNFRSLSWWLAAWDSLLPVVLPSLNVKNACCNGRVCERSHMVFVAMSACTHAYMSLFRVWLLVHAGCMLPEKCSLRFTKEIAIATPSRLQMAAGTFSVWVFCGMRNSGVSNCSLPLPVLVSDDLLQRLAHVGQSCLLCYVVPRVVLHHFVLMSDSRPEDLSWGQDSEVRNQCEGLWNFTPLWRGKHRITACRFWCSLTSLPAETRVA